MQNVYEWFVYNAMKASPNKFQFIILGNTGSRILQIGNTTIKSASSITLLDITIDSIHTLRRLRKFLTSVKVKILACSIIESKFAYCPLI